MCSQVVHQTLRVCRLLRGYKKERMPPTNPNKKSELTKLYSTLYGGVNPGKSS